MRPVDVPQDRDVLLAVRGPRRRLSNARRLVQARRRTSSFTLRQGEIVGLVGDAGSGKSTAALALLGLARPPGKILAGSVELRRASTC